MQSEVLSSELILLTDARLLLRSEVIVHLEELSNLLDTLALDERCNLGGSQLEKGLNVQVVGGEHDIK